MKRVITWIIEEKITLLIILLGIGIILGSLSAWAMLGGMIIYAVVILSVLNAAHRLYLKFRHK